MCHRMPTGPRILTDTAAPVENNGRLNLTCSSSGKTVKVPVQCGWADSGHPLVLFTAHSPIQWWCYYSHYCSHYDYCYQVTSVLGWNSLHLSDCFMLHSPPAILSLYWDGRAVFRVEAGRSQFVSVLGGHISPKLSASPSRMQLFMELTIWANSSCYEWHYYIRGFSVLDGKATGVLIGQEYHWPSSFTLPQVVSGYPKGVDELHGESSISISLTVPTWENHW